MRWASKTSGIFPGPRDIAFIARMVQTAERGNRPLSTTAVAGRGVSSEPILPVPAQAISYVFLVQGAQSSERTTND
jgi:hypothetical protein